VSVKLVLHCVVVAAGALTASASAQQYPAKGAALDARCKRGHRALPRLAAQ